MALLNWSDEYSVKIAAIDSQHKKIVELINELHTAMLHAKGKEVIGKVLEDLSSYTVFHFAAEEKLMKQYDYPGYSKQKSEHEKLSEQVKKLVEDYKSGKTIISQQVMQFLKDWLVNHIVGSDKKYSDYLNERGVK